MKKALNLFFCFFLPFCLHSQIDSVVFCLSNKGVPGLYLSKVNINTGTITYISPSVIGGGVTGNGAALNPYLQVYYFCDGPYQIKTLDLLTGTIVASAPISNTITDTFDQLIFNPSDSIIYGLARTFSPPAVYLGKIDPNSGVVTKISAISLSFGELGSSATVNPFSKIYYYINESNQILGVDLTSGNVVSTASVTNVNGQYFDLMQFNASDKTIYGLARKSSPPEVYLAKINSLTGLVTNISTISLSTSLSSAGSLLDPCNNNYYYIQAGDILTGANCSNGNGIVTVTASSQILEMRFNYKCHLNFTFSGINYNEPKTTFSFWPNPTDDFLNLSEDQIGTIIEISNAVGQIVLRSSDEKQINVSELAQGLYTLEIKSKGGESYYSKFVKE